MRFRSTTSHQSETRSIIWPSTSALNDFLKISIFSNINIQIVIIFWFRKYLVQGESIPFNWGEARRWKMKEELKNTGRGHSNNTQTTKVPVKKNTPQVKGETSNLIPAAPCGTLQTVTQCHCKLGPLTCPTRQPPPDPQRSPKNHIFLSATLITSGHRSSPKLWFMPPKGDKSHKTRLWSLECGNLTPSRQTT